MQLNPFTFYLILLKPKNILISKLQQNKENNHEIINSRAGCNKE